MSDITIVIPTSPRPSHPSTKIIDQAIISLRRSIPDAPIIITCDGEATPTKWYEEYKSSLKAKYENVIIYPSPVHQCEMLGGALPFVFTKYLLYWEDDWLLLPPVPWEELKNLIGMGYYNYIKLHAAPRISPYHEAMMRERVIHQGASTSAQYNDALGGAAIPMIQTVQFSANPHLALADWYRDMFHLHLDGHNDFIENRLHGIIGGSAWDDFRLGIYNPPEGDMWKIYHLDGKNTR